MTRVHHPVPLSPRKWSTSRDRKGAVWPLSRSLAVAARRIRAEGSRRFLTALALLVSAASSPAAEKPVKLDPKHEEFFESKVRPLLEQHCLSCHSEAKGKLRGGLALDTRAGWELGGDSGPVIVPGKPDESLFIEAIRYADDFVEMPPTGKLPAKDIAILERWVKLGAPDPRTGSTTAKKLGIDLAAGKNYWSFRPVGNPLPPKVQNSEWPLTDVDRFLLAAMEKKSITPVPDADPVPLLRRVTYDLTGLPPTHSDIDAFLADPSPDAYEKAVDRLLASSAFGEKWGRHWLDVARYADTNGSSNNIPFREAWRYRNWVIDSVNADMPYDQFVIRQIAGDLLPADSQAVRDANIIATGYLMFGSKVIGLFDKPTLFLDVVDEQIDSVGKGFLGLTLGCARCHDHKFDPVPTRDYYALAGIFSSTITLTGRLDEPKADENDYSRRGLGEGGDEKLRRLTEEDRWAWVQAGRKVFELQRKLEELNPKSGCGTCDAKDLPAYMTVLKEYKELLEKNEDLFSKLPPMAIAPRDKENPADEAIRIRGVASSPGEVVPRGFLQVAAFPGQPSVNREQSGRLELARWIASPKNPLTGRVAVNRVWAYLFGQGIVRTVDNFGTRGELPSHPELLDYLVDKLCFLKSLHTDGEAHGQAVLRLHTGEANFVRPSLGSWISYGLGTLNQSLPGFVCLDYTAQHGGERNYSNAFLPAAHQGTPMKLASAPGRKPQVRYLENDHLTASRQKEQVDVIRALGQAQLDAVGPDPQLEGVIGSFELAYKMQAVAPAVLDLSRETKETQTLYGIGHEPTDAFGRQCLLARRMSEAGVRFVQVASGYHWDHHGNIEKDLPKNAAKTDQPVAALIQDLDRRGLLDETLVLWAGEFGRTPVSQLGRGAPGRDHNPHGYTIFMAGGGVKPGFSLGATDDFGYLAVQDKVHMHDLHATLLHLLGIDHEKLTYRYAGRDFRLTDVYGRVVTEILA